MSTTETIAAIATPPGTGGIGILRLSGEQARDIGEALCRQPVDAGVIRFRRFLDAAGDAIDHGLCLYFPAPRSFSGEDCVEIQAHGGPIVLDMLLERVCSLGARLARPGEFSERAFLNGRIDLTQAEAIADLIESGSRAASRAAMRSLEGRFSEQVRALVEVLISLRIEIEAALDFADEDIEFVSRDDVGQQLSEALERLKELLAQAEQGRSLQEGVGVALAGLPNAGKSSLLNYLAGYEAAIVTEIEGTTRDVLREQVSLHGVPVRLYDTAGLREADNPVEREGIRRAWKSIEQADVVVYLIDATRGLTEADQGNIDLLRQSDAVRDGDTRLLPVYTKLDLLEEKLPDEITDLVISTKSGTGMDALITRITGQAADLNQERDGFMARRRHVDALQRALEALEAAGTSFADARPPELLAEDLRLVQRHLDEITGEFSSEDLLGRIFSSFCIGK